MTNAELNSLIKGELVSNALYKKYYTGTSITIKDISIAGIILDINSACVYDVIFANVEFTDSFEIKTGEFKNILFSGVTFSNDSGLFIRKSIVKNLSFKDKSKLASFNVYGSVFGGVSFFDTELNSVFITEAGKFDSLELMQSTIKKGVMIWNGEFKTLSVAGWHLPGIASISQIYFLDAKIDILDLSGSTSIDRVMIRRGTYENIIIKNPELKSFITTRLNPAIEPPLVINNFEFGGNGRLSLTIADLNINSLIFNQYYAYKESNFAFIGVKINNLEFKNYINFGELIYSGLSIEEEGKIIINNSDLGKTSFLNSNISDCKLLFKSSRITNVFLDGTELPADVSSSNLENRSLYSQVKKIYEAKGDSVNANIFYSKEMNSYNRTLTWKEDAWEKAIVFLNEYSTNHGQSWKRGLGSTVFFSALFYWVYLLILGFRLDLNGSFDVFYYFFEFINPVHKTDYIITELHLNSLSTPYMGFARIWEGISRIFIAYFIYQLIQAFRKHGRK